MEDGAKRRGRSSAALTKKFIPLSFAHSCECANVFWLEFHAISHFVFVLASLTARPYLSPPIKFSRQLLFCLNNKLLARILALYQVCFLPPVPKSTVCRGRSPSAHAWPYPSIIVSRLKPIAPALWPKDIILTRRKNLNQRSKTVLR